MRCTSTYIGADIFKRTLFVRICLWVILLVYLHINTIVAQSIAINTDGSAPDSKSILDVSSTSKGVLFPRMTTTERNAIASPPPGLLIYDTDLKTILMQNGTLGSPSWQQSAATINTWNVLGNASTTAGTNFLGTTDAVDLVFKTNNTENLRLTSGGDLGIGGTPSSSKLSITKSYANSTGSPINNYFTQKNSTTFSGTSAFTNSGGSRIDVSSSNTSSSNVLKGQRITMQTTGTAAADSVIGLEINMMNSSTGTIGKEYGIKISDISPQSGTLTNTVGLYIGDMTSGTQTNGAYAMYSADANARSYHAGNTGLGETNPTATLHVKGSFIFDDGTNDDMGKVLQFDQNGELMWTNPMQVGGAASVREVTTETWHAAWGYNMKTFNDSDQTVVVDALHDAGDDWCSLIWDCFSPPDHNQISITSGRLVRICNSSSALESLALFNHVGGPCNGYPYISGGNFTLANGECATIVYTPDICDGYWVRIE